MFLLITFHKLFLLRLEPDEQGRFGFNVQVRNLLVSFSSKCRHLWNVCDNGSKMSLYRTLLYESQVFKVRIETKFEVCDSRNFFNATYVVKGKA